MRQMTGLPVPLLIIELMAMCCISRRYNFVLSVAKVPLRFYGPSFEFNTFAK
jgi:hypothetical protein